MNEEKLKQLMDYYDCNNEESLIEEMSAHVDRLQVKLQEAEKNAIRPFRHTSLKARQG